MSSINVFISYSHADDALRKRLETHLSTLKRQGVIRLWSDRAIEAGTLWEEEILRNLRHAEIVLLLISADFLASDFCQDTELTGAMERHHTGQARVIPVFISSCDWKHAQFGKLQGVPDDAKPITQWSDRDEAFTRVCSAIRKTAEAILASRAAQSDRSAGDKKISVDFSKLHDVIDWEKVNSKVIKWAESQHAENPYNMGSRNYQKCLYDLGLGGEDYKLEYDEKGRLKPQ